MLKKYEGLYQRWSCFIRQYEGIVKGIRLINHSMTYVFYGIYPLFLLLRFLKKDPGLLWYILVPGASFLLLSLVRRLINRPRPYTALDIDPLIVKSEKRESMPSRHVFSATMIAMTVYAVYPAFGTGLLVLSLILAVVRVLAGIHYPSDVTAGLAIGILCGHVLFWLVGR